MTIEAVLDEATGIYIGADGKRYDLVGSGGSETLVPMDPDPEVLERIRQNNARAEEAKARLEPQRRHHLDCVAKIEAEMRAAGVFVPRSR